MRDLQTWWQTSQGTMSQEKLTQKAFEVYPNDGLMFAPYQRKGYIKGYEDFADYLRKEIHQLHLKLPWGACASQLEMEAYCKDEAYKEVLELINKFVN